MSFTKITLFLTIISLYSCFTKNDPNCIPNNKAQYSFHLPVSLSPALDTFDVGDTITIISEFPDTMLEVHSGQMVELIDWSFYPIVSLYRIDGEESIDSILNTFEVLIDPVYFKSFYEFHDGRVILDGKYDYEEGRYKIEYKIIPTEAGLYFHSLGSALYLTEPHAFFEGKCSNTPVSARVIMNNGTEDNNAIFLLDSPNENEHIRYERRNKDDGSFNNNGGYCFYVR